MALKNVTQDAPTFALHADAPLRPWAYVFLAVVAAVIGLASSAVTADFFIIGLERMEADVVARDALIAAGILMVVTELVAFGLAALLPRQTLRGLRVQLMLCGALLLSFEAVTIYMTQATLVQASHAVATASTTRITDLRASIDNQRSAALGLRDGGTLQSASSNSWTRHLGAVALRSALEVEQNLLPLAAELAQLEAKVQPTMTDVLGTQGMLAYTVTRAMLISVMGLVMFGAAGALLRAARETAYARATVTTVTPVSAGVTVGVTAGVTAVTAGVTVAPVPRVSYQHGVTAAPGGWAACLPSLRFMAVPLAALAVSPLAFGATVTPTVTAPLQSASQWSQPESQGESQYQRVRHGVLAGAIKPSVRGIQAQFGGGTEVVRRYLLRLEAEGVTVRVGQGWVKQPTA